MELKEVFEPIVNFLKNFQKKEKETSKIKAKERLQLVLMQDRASVSPDFFEMMKKEIIDVIKKYIEIDEETLEVQLTRGFEGDDGTGPALYANIPIKNIKPIAKKVEEQEESENQKIEEQEENEVENVDQEETTEEELANTIIDEIKTVVEEKQVDVQEKVEEQKEEVVVEQVSTQAQNQNQANSYKNKKNKKYNKNKNKNFQNINNKKKTKVVPNPV